MPAKCMRKRAKVRTLQAARFLIRFFALGCGTEHKIAFGRFSVLLWTPQIAVGLMPDNACQGPLRLLTILFHGVSGSAAHHMSGDTSP